MVALARTVTVNNKTFVKGTDHTAIPGWAVDQIRNPDNWVGGVAPPLSHPAPEQPVEGGLTPSQLRAKLGLDAALAAEAAARVAGDTAAVGAAAALAIVFGA